MQKKITLQLTPSEAANHAIITSYIAATIGVNENAVTGFYTLKQNIDARSRKQIWINITVNAFINDPFIEREIEKNIFPDVHQSNKKIIIVGAGPAGIFAALKLIQHGIKPIIIERGKDVRSRRRDLATLNKEGIINPESNYCFGEGGAGTYSDGKLYTRSNKRGDINRILNLFVQFGADENILVEAHPHIGTNKLPHIITAMRKQMIDCGGEVLFEKKLTDFIMDNNELKGIITADGDKLFADAVIVATGHSARDIFELLYKKNILIEAKPFALGVRIEHPQEVIDAAQYHLAEQCTRDKFLPPAAYSLVEQVQDKGVFSFCMCPGGIIAPASTNQHELVVNGWSPSKRNNPFANSGMVVSVAIEDILQDKKLKVEHTSPLALMKFQKMVEEKAYQAGGGKFVAPAQRVVDFCTNKISTNLPSCSYLPGLNSADLKTVLPAFIYSRLQQGLQAFGKRMKGYYTNEAVLVATESRTSSPIRIPRNAETLQHPQIKNLYPCAEGAGYAGGIVSAAMDGEKVANAIAAFYYKS
ncbi:MAG: FAD-dependent monooxygenase [Chitinophagaceae bacterium]|nr:FAD-dependent monooxygenase [Chitinophagaceae bacterium]MCW5905878.1 FAD-dependent monooxygenase [Chitinophagaceae bacterium]